MSVAKFSTASLGKFQGNLPKEKQAKNIKALLPNCKKRKPAPLTPVEERKSNLDILDNILGKKPKLDIEKAVNRVLNTEQREYVMQFVTYVEVFTAEIVQSVESCRQRLLFQRNIPLPSSGC
jgi:hypothetical protein